MLSSYLFIFLLYIFFFPLFICVEVAINHPSAVQQQILSKLLEDYIIQLEKEDPLFPFERRLRYKKDLKSFEDVHIEASKILHNLSGVIAKKRFNRGRILSYYPGYIMSEYEYDKFPYVIQTACELVTT